VVTSALSRPLTAPSEEVLTSVLPRPPTRLPPYREDVVTSALPHPPTAPADFAMQRVDSRNVYTRSSEQWLPEFPPPSPVHRQVLLLSACTQTTASDYVNPVPVLSAHSYADIPFDSINYQNIFPNLSLPTHTNVPTHIAVEQPGLSAFSRVDVHHSRPAVADPTVQYTVGTSVGTSMALLQSPPSVHWRKRLAYDYVQPDTGLGAPIHAAPAIHSGYIRPQISDTHTHKIVWTCTTCHLEKLVQ